MVFMSKRILFHGTNEARLNERFRQICDLPANWTSCPLDALNHSNNSSRRHGSKIAVLSYPASVHLMLVQHISGSKDNIKNVYNQ